MREKCRAAGMDLDHEAGGMDAEISFTAMLLTLPSETWKNRDRRVLDVGFGKMKINKPENGVCLTLPSEIWKRKTSSGRHLNLVFRNLEAEKTAIAKFLIQT